MRRRARSASSVPTPSAQNRLNDVLRVSRRHSRPARRADGLENDAKDQVEANFNREGGHAPFALGETQVCLQTLPGRTRECRKRASPASDQSSPGGIALSFGDEHCAAGRNAGYGVGGIKPACIDQILERLRQLRGNRSAEVIETAKVRIERAFRDLRLPRYVFDRNRGDWPAREEEASGLDDLRAALLARRWRPISARRLKSILANFASFRKDDFFVLTP